MVTPSTSNGVRSPIGSRQSLLALQWLQELLATLSSSQRLLFLLGNHDCLTAFVIRLNQLAESDPRLTVEPETYQLGRNLFLHGDPANRQMTHNGFIKERERWKTESRRPTPIHHFFAIADQLGISPLLHRLIFPSSRTLRRIAYYLDDHHPTWEQDYDTIFFGHTHCVLDEKYRGTRFVNTGSAIPKMGFNPVEFEF